MNLRIILGNVMIFPELTVLARIDLFIQAIICSLLSTTDY